MKVNNVLVHKTTTIPLKKRYNNNLNNNGVVSIPFFNDVHAFDYLSGRSFLSFKRAESVSDFMFSKPDLIGALSKIVEKDKNSQTPIIKSVSPTFISDFAQRVVDNSNKNILIGLSGESASGKSTICDSIVEISNQLDVPVEVISADNYFKDISELIKKYGSFDAVVESGYDVDSPDNFDMQQLHNDLFKLSNGEDVLIPKYLVNGTGISVPNAIPKKAQKIIVVEGLATLYNPVRDLLDAEIYVDIDETIQEERYIKRAMASRNQTEQDAKAQLNYVKKAAQKYLYPKKDSSDIIIDGAVQIDKINNLIVSLVESLV